MKLAIFNGSPRNKGSNSKILIDHFLKGYGNVRQDVVPIHYLANTKKIDEGLKIFSEAEIIILIFPLYTDCMPSIVKEFFEKLVEQKDLKTKSIGFIVQSGFPEAIHSVYVERYLQKFTKRLHYEYLGTVIKGGVEGIQSMPPFMTKKIYQQFNLLGEYFAKNEAFSPEIKEKLYKPYKMSWMRRIVWQLLPKRLTNFYWDSHLKKNGTFNNRFDKPLVD